MLPNLENLRKFSKIRENFNKFYKAKNIFKKL